MTLTDILLFGGAIIFGAIASQVIFSKLKFIDIEKAQAKSDKMISESREEGEEIKKEAEKSAKDIKANTEAMVNQMKTLIHTIEKNINFKEQSLAKKNNKNNQYRSFIKEAEGEIKGYRIKHKDTEKQIKENLALRLGLRIEDLRQKLIKDFEKELSEEVTEKVAKLEESTRENAEKEAKNILKGAMQRFADRTSVEKREAKVIVPRDEAKKVIVGKDAENVMLLEKLLEVDIVFNDEPKTIHVSSFDLLKKNVARLAIEKLVKKRRINEKDIHAAIKEAKKEISKDLVEVGEKAIKKMRFKKKFPPELIKIIGRLKYRTSYGQNILLHAFEVAYMAELLASELGIDPDLTKSAAFFHDIGKAIDQEVEGSHDFLTREIMTKFKFPEEEIHAAWTHHEAETPNTPEAKLVMAADAISAGRPGARQESLEKYLERLTALEEIAGTFEGVQKTYAISAGRELRVMVSSEEVDDKKMKNMAEEIADKIEDKLSYPGKIKVNVIRRTRAIDFAK